MIQDKLLLFRSIEAKIKEQKGSVYYMDYERAKELVEDELKHPIKTKLRKLYGQLLYKLKQKEVKEAIARNLQESTKDFSLKKLKNLRKVYEEKEPSELDKAFIEELDRIIARKQRLAKFKWNN